jgi:hypothetical protein
VIGKPDKDSHNVDTGIPVEIVDIRDALPTSVLNACIQATGDSSNAVQTKPFVDQEPYERIPATSAITNSRQHASGIIQDEDENLSSEKIHSVIPVSDVKITGDKESQSYQASRVETIPELGKNVISMTSGPESIELQTISAGTTSQAGFPIASGGGVATRAPYCSSVRSLSSLASSGGHMQSVGNTQV